MIAKKKALYLILLMSAPIYSMNSRLPTILEVPEEDFPLNDNRFTNKRITDLLVDACNGKLEDIKHFCTQYPHLIYRTSNSPGDNILSAAVHGYVKYGIANAFSVIAYLISKKFPVSLLLQRDLEHTRKSPIHEERRKEVYELIKPKVHKVFLY